MDILVCLAEQANEVVTRSDLLDAVWNDHVAADELLTGAVSDLRQALRVDGTENGHIDTVPKIGYRLVGDVVLPDDAETGLRSPRFLPAALILVGAVLALTFVVISGPGDFFGRTAHTPITSIAVLPLANLSGDPEQDYISDGMTESLILQISRIGSLRVPSYQTIRQFRDSDQDMTAIGRKLNVDAVLEGSALIVDDRLRVTVQLIDARTDDHLWAESFDRDLGDVLQIHSEIAIAVADAVDVKLSPEKRTMFASVQRIDPEAYRLFLEARALEDELSETSFRQCIDVLQRSIEIEPEFAPAHAGLAACYLFPATWHGSEEIEDVLPSVNAALDEAMRLDPDLAETWFIRGWIRRFEWDWLGADRAFRMGLELDPEHVDGRISYANFLITMGRFDEAVAIATALLELSPDLPVALNELAFAHFMAGESDEAVNVAERSLGIDPDFGQTRWLLAEIYASLGENDKVIEYYLDRKRRKSDPSPNDVGIAARLYAFVGDEQKARSLLEQLLELRSKDDRTSAWAIAEVYLGLGELDNSYEWVRVAYEERDLSLVWLNVDPYFAKAREQDPRFEELLVRMGIPDQN